MREDMSRVLVESPRTGRASAHAVRGSRRKRRDRLDRDGESAPQRLGMNGEGLARKHFGEHLGPLYRYLRQQVHRPWDKVYSELCSQLDRRSVVQAHLFQHIDDKVERETVWQDGEVWIRHHWRHGPVPLADSRAEMFVHPLTGILLPNRAGAIERRRERDERARRRTATPPDRRTGLPGMPADVQWHRIEGLWYEVTLKPLGAELAFDVVLKRLLRRDQRELLRTTYGRSDRYASAKRQLSHKQLRAHRLVSDTAD